jgi:hypothetical protein
MSSATSTSEVRLKPDRLSADTRSKPNGAPAPAESASAMQPWQFFVLAALGCATAVTFLIRGQGVIAVLMVSVLMGAAALVGLASLRALRPLVAAHDDRTVIIGERTRAALEREKVLTLRALKDLEFDRAMGKVSEEDFHDMTGPLRARAARLIRQLDAGGGYRAAVERDLAKRLGEPKNKPAAHDAHVCASCSTANDIDAKFCKNCGAKL